MGNNTPLFLDYRKNRALLPFGAALLLIITGLLGCLAIYRSRAFGDAPVIFAVRQLLWLFPGIAVFLTAAAIPFRFYRKAAFSLLLISLAALTAVLFRGTAVNGMRGWFDLGFFRFQPSEFAKPLFLLYLCVCCGRGEPEKAGVWFRMIPAGFLMTGLVMAEPDYGTAE